MAVGSSAVLQIRDYADEPENAELSPIIVPSYQIDAANLATWLTGWGAVKTAVAALCLGVQAQESINIYNTALSLAAATDPFAQRELKIRLSYRGNDTFRSRKMDVPCPDLDAITLYGKDNVLLDDSAGTNVMAPLVTALEAIMRMSDDDSEEVTFTGAKVVGKNI